MCHLGREDEVLVPGQFQAGASATDELVRHITDILLSFSRFIASLESQDTDFRQGTHLMDTIRLHNHTAVKERIGSQVEILLQQLEIHYLDTKFEITSGIAVAYQTVGMGTAESIRTAKSF